MATILIVDDHPVNREYLVSLLSHQNHRLLEASDGAEALALARAERPDLVISDILMPTMDGYEFVHQLRRDEIIGGTPVIFCTAHYLRREARSLALACGVSFIITKPTEPEMVLGVIEAALGQEAPAWPSPHPDFDREHLQVITNKLCHKADELTATNTRLTALIELASDFASERDPARLLESFCHAGRSIIGARYAMVGVLDDEGRTLRHFLTSGMDADSVDRIGTVAPRLGLLGKVLVEARAQRRRLSDEEHDDVALLPHHPSVQSLLAVPIVSPSRVYGWFCLTEKLGLPEFTDEDEQLAIVLSGQLGRVYENGLLYLALEGHAAELEREASERKRAEAALRRHARRIENLREIDRAILGAESTAQIADAALGRIRQLLPCQLAAVALFDTESGSALVIARNTDREAGSLDVATIPLNEFASPRIFRDHPRLHVDDIAAVEARSPVLEHLVAVGMRSLVTEAILAEDELLGLVSLAAVARGAFTREHEEIAREVADHLGIAIRQSRLRQQLEAHQSPASTADKDGISRGWRG